MGARILVHSGISAGSIHWIERSVIRVGSDPSADLCIPNPNLHPHALTVEYRQQDYWVYNRSSQPVFLGGRVLSPGGCERWIDSDILEFQDGMQLAIDLDDVSAPEPQPARQFDEEPPQSQPETGPPAPRGETGDPHLPAGEPSPNGTSKSRGSQALPLAVIALCGIGCVGLLVRHQNRDEVAGGVNRPSFESIVRQSLGDEDMAVPPELIRHLQYAEGAVVRNNRPAARQRYRQLRDALVAGSAQADLDPAAAEPSQLRQEILQLVEYRLEQLGDR